MRVCRTWGLPLFKYLTLILNKNHSLCHEDSCLNQSRGFKVYISSAALHIDTESYFLLKIIWIVFRACRPKSRQDVEALLPWALLNFPKSPTNALTPTFPGLLCPLNFCKVNRRAVIISSGSLSLFQICFTHYLQNDPQELLTSARSRKSSFSGSTNEHN